MTDGLPRPAAFQWEPLGYDRDPVPGDYTAVKDLADHYRNVADAISAAAKNLRKMSEAEGWEGEAAKEFTKKADGVANLIDDAWGRYDEAAKALKQYHPQHSLSQVETFDLREEAEREQGELETAQRKADASQSEDAANHDQHDKHQGAVSASEDALGRLHDQAEVYRDDFHAAAGHAATRIEEFIKDDGLNDDWTDDVGGFLGDLKSFFIALGEIAGIVAAVCGILAAVCSFIPVLAPLAAVFGTIALIATCFSLLGNILQGDGMGIILDVVGIATFGIGRVLGAGGKLTAALAKSKAMPAVSSGIKSSLLGGRAGTHAIMNIKASMGLSSLRQIANVSRTTPRGLGDLRGIGTELVGNTKTVFSRQFMDDVAASLRNQGLKGSTVFGDARAAGDARAIQNLYHGNTAAIDDITELTQVRRLVKAAEISDPAALETIGKAFTVNSAYLLNQGFAVVSGTALGFDSLGDTYMAGYESPLPDLDIPYPESFDLPGDVPDVDAPFATSGPADVAEDYEGYEYRPPIDAGPGPDPSSQGYDPGVPSKISQGRDGETQ